VFRNFLLTFLLASTAGFAEERFPVPTSQEVLEASQKIEQYGMNEVLDLSLWRLAKFGMGYYWGRQEPFTYYNCNPQKITDPQLPATFLLHASQSNQGEWLPLLASLENKKDTYVFSHNFNDDDAQQALIEKIGQIRALYLAAGAETVRINLVGHSLGGIVAAEYAFDNSSAIEGTTVEKVITIAARLKNIDRPADLPFYPYCYLILQRIDILNEKIESNRGAVKLYTIAAENDWLLPRECVLVGDEQAIIPSCGHVLVTHSEETHKKVIEWLSE
jgi:PGAP1-like protein